MAKKITIECPKQEESLRYCMELETGNILFFPSIPFSFPQEEIDCLLKQKNSQANIVYRPQADGSVCCDQDGCELSDQLKEILRSYSKKVSAFLTDILVPYSKEWRVDETVFKPFQEMGRKFRLEERADLLHVEASFKRPLHGDRILRFFTNINPEESRRWITSEPFVELVKKYGGGAVKFPKSVGYSLSERLGRRMKQWLWSSGVKIPLRSPYDVFMLKMRSFLQKNGDFQKNSPRDHWEFPPNCCWAVFTDQVSHAVLSGQYSLEQTFLVPIKSLLRPEHAPMRVLERICDKNLLDPELRVLR